MIEKLLNHGLISKWRLLLEYYKKIGMDEQELVLVLLVMHLSTISHRFITPNIIASYSHFKNDQVDVLFDSLKAKELLSVEVKSQKHEMSFTPLFNKLMATLNKEASQINNDKQLIAVINKFTADPVTAGQQSQLLKAVYNRLSPTYLESLLVKQKPPIKVDQIITIINEAVEQRPSNLTKFNWLDNQ